MKKIIKTNGKIIIAFILGMFISGVTVSAVTLSFASGDVEHTKSDGTKTNVKAAINDLYSKATAGDATSDQILSGKKALVHGNLVTGTMPNRGNITDAILKGASFPAGYYSNWDFTRLQYANATSVGWYDSNGTQYGHVHMPEAYYYSGGQSWAPEIRLTKSQIEGLAKDSGIADEYFNKGQNVASGSEYDVYMAIICGTDRDTKGYVESAALFPVSSSENTKYAYYDTDGPSDGPISVPGITLTLQGYSSGFHYKVKATKAGTLYNAKTGSIIKSLSANEEYTLSDDHTVGVAKINVYYFKFS